MHREIIRGPAPAKSATLAQELWWHGISLPDLFELTASWDEDPERAWRECDRLELLLAIALVRKAPLDRVCLVASTWLERAMQELSPGLAGDELALIALARGCATTPDPTARDAEGTMLALVQRAQRRGAGKHRYRLLTAAAYLAGMAYHRGSTWPWRATWEAHLVGVHVTGAFLEARESADLFSSAVDFDGFRTWALELARERCTTEG